MTILLLEDEYPAAERLQRLLRQAEPAAEVLAVLQTVAVARHWLCTQPAPDLILSDIQLRDGLSFEAFAGLPLRSPIVLTTAYDEYAIQAFEVHSIGYLLKPVKPEALRAALARFRVLRAAYSPAELGGQLQRLLDNLPPAPKPYKTRFLVGNGSQLLPVEVSDIAYFSTRHEQTSLVLRVGPHYALDYTLEQLERLLDPRQFFRANRQLLLHLSAVRRLHPHFNGKLKLDLLPAPADEVLVSREKAAAFRAWLEGDA